MLHVTDIQAEKWRTIEDSNLWPLPSEGWNAPFVRPMFAVCTVFRSCSGRVASVQSVTRNRNGRLPGGHPVRSRKTARTASNQQLTTETISERIKNVSGKIETVWPLARGLLAPFLRPLSVRRNGSNGYTQQWWTQCF